VKRIGVLALQGAFIEHITTLYQLGVDAMPIRLPQEIEGLSGLIIPGGESTTIGKLMGDYELRSKVQELISDGLPIFGTCAGMILLAKKVIGFEHQPLGAMGIEVRRNAFGRQVDSFEAELEIPALGEDPFRGVFIRAPWIEQTGNGVEVLARLPNGVAVAARERNILVSAFHPELSGDFRLHRYFLSIIDGSKRAEGL
jgi:5'-phosphate synthase pdxT subunit